MTINFGNGIVTGNIILRTSRSGGGGGGGGVLKEYAPVYPMWYATPKDWSGTEIFQYTGGRAAPSSDYAGQYNILASGELGYSDNESDWKLKNAFDRNFTNQWVGHQNGYSDYVTITLSETNGNPRPLYIYMKGRYINNWSQTEVVVSFSNNGGNTWEEDKTLIMNFCGNISGPSEEEYMWLSANYIIPETYRNYDRVKIAGNGVGRDDNFFGFAEINLLFPRDIATVPGYINNGTNGKPYVSDPVIDDDLTLNGSNVNGSSILSGSNAFYIDLKKQTTVIINAIITCVTNANFTYKISMFIDSTVTDYVENPNNEIIKVDISGTFQNSGLQTFPQISWSGTLSNGYHIITFAQLLDSTEKTNKNNVLIFNNLSKIDITCEIT